jgi:hypothetical protein
MAPISMAEIYKVLHNIIGCGCSDGFVLIMLLKLLFAKLLVAPRILVIPVAVVTNHAMP